MKNKFIISTAVLMLLALPVSSFAGKLNKSMGISYTEIQGRVVELIPHQSALIVKDSDDGKEVHIHVDRNTLSTLAIGDTVKFSMQGTNCVITDLKKK